MKHRGLLAAGLVLAGALWWGARWAPQRAETPFEAAQAILSAPDGRAVLVQAPENDEVFRALEALSPAPFSLRCAVYIHLPGKPAVYERLPEGAAAQEEAAVLAGAIARQETAGMTDPREKLRALHDALVTRVVYDEDAAAAADPTDGADAPFTAWGALHEGRAVCAGYARAYQMLCAAAGIDAVYVTSDEMNHGWNAVRLDGETYYIDCTFDDPVPDMGEYVVDDFFLLTGEELAQTHTWDEAFYEGLLDGIENFSKNEK